MFLIVIVCIYRSLQADNTFHFLSADTAPFSTLRIVTKWDAKY